MRTHPVFLRLDGRRCVVIGGDETAAVKARACIDAGGDVTVIAPALIPDLARTVAAGGARHVARAYHAGDLAGAFLAYASTRDPELVGCLRAEAERERVLLNVADTPDACTFIAPAVLARGELQVAGGDGWGEARAGLPRAHGDRRGRRARVWDAGGDPGRGPARAPGGARARPVLGRLLDSPLLDLVRRGRRAEIDALLETAGGTGCTLERLGIALEGDAHP
jgi:precorrin-2 dehydrogenase/sirohydrochlorin ferrochelatase